MVDVKNKRCIREGCNLINPVFNIEGSKKGLYCKIHKKENMVDVINKRCIGCNLRPSFNIEGSKAGLYCKAHKKENMVDVLHKQWHK
jgi:hypothetical protein